MRLSLSGMVVAAAVIWGGAILLVGLMNIVQPNYGTNFLQLTSSVYPWFHSAHSVRSVLIGTIDGAIDGAIAALIFVGIYNSFVAADRPKLPQA